VKYDLMTRDNHVTLLPYSQLTHVRVVDKASSPIIIIANIEPRGHNLQGTLPGECSANEICCSSLALCWRFILSI
jgi:hypothetical protein